MRAPLEEAVQRRHRARLRVHEAEVRLEVRQLDVRVVVARRHVRGGREGAERDVKPEDVLEAAPERRLAAVEQHQVALGVEQLGAYWRQWWDAQHKAQRDAARNVAVEVV